MGGRYCPCLVEQVMSVKYNRVGNKITLNMEGEFGGDCRADFQRIFSSQEKHPENLEFVIDFKDVSYISSVGAGLLIRLREYCGGEESNISLINVNSRILKLLSVLRFDQLFLITPG